MTIAETVAGAIAGAAGKKLVEAAIKETRTTKHARPNLEKAIERAMRNASKRGSEDPQTEDFREALFAELYKLIPDAIRQAKGTQRTPPRPALLRMLIRACK
jgi:hypothetical protein